MSRPIQALSFDLDDTLWDIWPVIARAERLLHDWLARHHPELTALYDAGALRELTAEVAAVRPELAHDRSALRRAALCLAAERAGIVEEFCEHRAFRVFQQARNEVELFPETLPVLSRLRTRYTLFALSNGNADLGLIGIDHLFELALNPEGTGLAKPEPAMFLEPCRMLGLEPARVVHIGDDPELDVAGASAVGMRTVWFNRSARPWTEGRCWPDAEIRSLSELEDVLLAWE